MNEASILERTMTGPAVTVRGLDVRSIAKAYDKRAVLHDVSLSVSRGEVVGLLLGIGAGMYEIYRQAMRIEGRR